MKARDLMTTHELWTCNDSTDCRQAARMMAEYNVGSLPIVDLDDRLVGIVTDRDICCRLVAEGKSYETPVGEIMTTSVQTCTPDADFKEIEAIMREHQVRRLPVVDERQRIQGLISLADLASHCHGFFQERHVAEVLEAVSSRSVHRR